VDLTFPVYGMETGNFPGLRDGNRNFFGLQNGKRNFSGFTALDLTFYRFRKWMEMIKSISSGIIPEVHVTDKLS